MKYVYCGHEGFHEAVSERLEKAGFVRTACIDEAEAVLTFCLSQTTLEDAYFGENGFVQTAHPQTLLVDLSASTPGFARELNAVSIVSDLVFVEAPLLLDDVASPCAFDQRENMQCLVAGEDGDIARAEGLLSAIAGALRKTGGSGSAQLARAAHSLQLVAQVVAAVEADALYRASAGSIVEPGFPNARVSALSPQAARVLDSVNEGRFDGSFSVEMFMSGLSAALMAADDADLILPQAEAAMHLLELLAVIGGADMAPSALSLVYGDEKRCAENGLDWTRAEGVFEGEGDACGDECTCGHGGSVFDGAGDDDFDYTSN